MATLHAPSRPLNLPEHLTPRTQRLQEELLHRAFADRSTDWILPENLPDLSVTSNARTGPEPVIIRRAKAIAEMLAVMTDPVRSLPTPSYHIFEGELLVGVPAMGSNGLGKVFPEYLDQEERRMAAIANRTELSVLGHNAIDFKRVVSEGIRPILKTCDEKQAEIEARKFAKRGDRDRHDFYAAVRISCQAVVDYARKFAELAGQLAAMETNLQRKRELEQIQRICNKVPMEPAETFWEALQSVLFVHIALRAGMDLTSFGRLDQALQPYLEHTVERGKKDLGKAVELVECFVIKEAWGLNLTQQYLVEQDHFDYGIMLGTRPFYSDQIAAANNFLQNVVVGGRRFDGTDETVEATHVLIQGFANANLSTPGLYVRMHKQSPSDLRERVAKAIAATKNIPAILNDDVVIPALYKTLIEDGNLAQMPPEYAPLAADYCVDGCWEPILHGVCDWTFKMINGLTILECALNGGATLDSNPVTLRGVKMSERTQPVTDYQSLMGALQTHMNFLVSQATVAMYNYYLLDEFVSPTPLLSAFLGTCLERGRDKSWGGTRYCIAGCILEGLPNMVNSIAAIKKWVFDQRKYAMADVLGAYRYNFDPDKNPLYEAIKNDFRTDSPTFGSNDEVTTEIAKTIITYFTAALQDSKRFADGIYLTDPKDWLERQRVERLRMAAGYYGPSLQTRLGEDDVTIRFTAALGTFEIYALLGQGVAASADRDANQPIAMNITPPPGTVEHGYGHILASLKHLDLSRLAAGAPLDLCLRVEEGTDPTRLVAAVLDKFIADNGHTLSITLGTPDEFSRIYKLCRRAETGDKDAIKELPKWRHVNVRAGGWNTPFVVMEEAQQKHYTLSPIDAR